MANQVAYSSKSIINISKDTPKVTYNNVEIEGNQVKLVGKARAGFEYSFKSSGDTIKSDNLLLGLKVISSNLEDITRYNGNISVLIHIQYWEEIIDSAGIITGYTDGEIDIFKLFPYLSSEKEGYFDEYNLILKNNLIKNIYIEFINLSESVITFDKITLNYSITVSQAIVESVGFDISLLGVNWYPNGFMLEYAGNDNKDKFYWNGDEKDELNGINVNGVKLIYMRNHSELLD